MVELVTWHFVLVVVCAFLTGMNLGTLVMDLLTMKDRERLELIDMREAVHEGMQEALNKETEEKAEEEEMLKQLREAVGNPTDEELEASLSDKDKLIVDVACKLIEALQGVNVEDN